MSSSRGRSRASASLKKSDVDLFEKVSDQLKSLRDDFAVLSKSKPDAPLNPLKVSFVNEKLAEANSFLTGEHKPFKTFEQFDPDQLPSNSDVQIVLSQYLSCLEGWRSAHVVKRGYHWEWDMDGEKLRADQPTRASTKDL
jgi:hypothetical protein